MKAPTLAGIVLTEGTVALGVTEHFARIDEMRDLDPDSFSELDTPKSVTKAKEKNHAHSTVDKVQLARLEYWALR